METGSWNWCREQQTLVLQPGGPTRGPADFLVQRALHESIGYLYFQACAKFHHEVPVGLFDFMYCTPSPTKISYDIMFSWLCHPHSSIEVSQYQFAGIGIA